MCHAKNSLFTLTVFNYGLCSVLTGKTGFFIYSCELVPLKLLIHYFLEIMHKCTYNVDIHHGKHSLFTLTFFSSGLYANLQRTIGIPYYNCALIP